MTSLLNSLVICLRRFVFCFTLRLVLYFLLRFILSIIFRFVFLLFVFILALVLCFSVLLFLALITRFVFCGDWAWCDFRRNCNNSKKKSASLCSQRSYRKIGRTKPLTIKYSLVGELVAIQNLTLTAYHQSHFFLFVNCPVLQSRFCGIYFLTDIRTSLCTLSTVTVLKFAIRQSEAVCTVLISCDIKLLT